MEVVDKQVVDDQLHDGSLILVSGPSRGGKSRWAESLLIDEPRVVYIATAAERPDDLDWQNRLRLHRERRPNHWNLVESGAELPAVITQLQPSEAALIDALGGFVAQHLERGQSAWEQEATQLVDALKQCRSTCVVVIEETGWGVVPPTRIGGLFRDRLGTLAQCLDRQADGSWLVLQGRALDLHRLSQPVP